MLSMCYAISSSAIEADQIWWKMPLSKVWAMLHCSLHQQGVTVAYSTGRQDLRKCLRKANDQHKNIKPAFEQNIDQTEYLR